MTPTRPGADRLPPARLRPRDVGELLDLAGGITRTHPALVLGGSVLITALTVLIRLGVDAGLGLAVDDTHRAAGGQLGPSLATLPLVTATAAALVAPATGAAAMGATVDTTTLRSGWHGRRTVLSLLGTLAILAPIALLPTALAWTAMQGGRATAEDMPLAVLGGVALSEILLLPVTCAPAIGVLEQLRPWAAVRRSWRIALAQPRRLLAAALVTRLLSLILVAALTVSLATISGLAGSFLGLTSLEGPVGTVLAGLMVAFVLVVALPFEAQMRVLSYVDTRVRTEGFDLLQVAAVRAVRTPAQSAHPGSLA